MTDRAQWTAILAGLLLLAAQFPLPEAARGSEWSGSLTLGAERRAAAAVRADIHAALLRANPLLGAHNAERVTSAILRCEREQALSPELVLAVLLVESGARPAVRSAKGALGLMQVMPHMFRQLELPGHAGHIEANIEAGCLLLAGNIRRLGEKDGISAYFWGGDIRGEGYLRRVRTMRDRLVLKPRAGSARSRG